MLKLKRAAAPSGRAILALLSVVLVWSGSSTTVVSAEEMTTMVPMHPDAGVTIPSSSLASSPIEATTAANCDEEEMRKKNDCCKPFQSVMPPSDIEDIVKKVVEVENMRDNSTVWALEKVESAEKKDCSPALYKVLSKLMKTPHGENGTSVDCQMRFRYGATSADEGAADTSEETIALEAFCNAADVACRGLSSLIGVASVILTLVARNSFSF